MSFSYPTDSLQAQVANGSPHLAIETAQIGDIFLALRRRIWVIAGAVLAALALGILYVSTTAPLFTSTASVLIDARVRDIAESPGVVSNLSAEAAVVDTQVAVIRSESMTARVLKELDLIRDPRFLAIAGLAEADNAADPGPAILALQSLVRVERETMTSLIRIRVTSPWSDLSARIANQFADSYVQLDLETKYLATEKANDWLRDRLTTLQEEVKRSEAEVELYRSTEGLVSSRGSTLAESQMADLTTALSQAQAELTDTVARLETTRRALETGGSVENLPEVMRSPVVTQLRAQIADVTRRQAEYSASLGPEHPDMIKVSSELRNLQGELTAEANRILSTLQSEVDFSRRRVASLSASLSAWEARLGAQGSAAIKLRELERNASANEELYQSFLTLFKQTSESAGAIQTSVRVLSPALAAPYPSWPRSSLIYALACALGLAMGLLAAFGLEAIEQGFRSTEEVRRHLGLSVISSVRQMGPLALRGAQNWRSRLVRKAEQVRFAWQRLKRTKAPLASDATSPSTRSESSFHLREATRSSPAEDTTTLPEYVVDRPISSIAESLRALGTFILSIRKRDKGTVVLMTSALSGEGKTSVVLGLARVMAKSDIKILVIDLDLRKATLSEQVFGVPVRGVEDALADPANALDRIRKDVLSNARVLPARVASVDEAGALTQGSLTAMLDALRDEFDLILLDGPPVSPVADALVIAQAADHILLVLEWRRTPRQLVRMLQESLSRLGCGITGVVMTKTPVRNGAYGVQFSQYSSKYGYVQD